MWTPGQRKRLLALREQFWCDPVFASDRDVAICKQRWTFARWLVTHGYMHGDLEAAPFDAEWKAQLDFMMGADDMRPTFI